MAATDAQKQKRDKRQSSEASKSRTALASICSYSTPSPDSRDRVESVSNDSLVSFSPPDVRRGETTSTQGQPQSPTSVQKKEDNTTAATNLKKSHHKKKKEHGSSSASKHKKKNRARSRSSSQSRSSHRKKKRRHDHDRKSESPVNDLLKESKEKKSLKHTRKQQPKVVPKVYQQSSRPPAHVDISPLSSPDAYEYRGGRSPYRYESGYPRRRSPSRSPDRYPRGGGGGRPANISYYFLRYLYLL